MSNKYGGLSKESIYQIVFFDINMGVKTIKISG
jgi:hypothetical protein